MPDAGFNTGWDPDSAHPLGPIAHCEGVTPVTAIAASFMKLCQA